MDVICSHEQRVDVRGCALNVFDFFHFFKMCFHFITFITFINALFVIFVNYFFIFLILFQADIMFSSDTGQFKSFFLRPFHRFNNNISEEN